MKFGFFDDAAKEYVITSPQTPYPWINYLGTQDFFSLISTQQADTASIRTLVWQESHVTVTITFPQMQADAIST